MVGVDGHRHALVRRLGRSSGPRRAEPRRRPGLARVGHLAVPPRRAAPCGRASICGRSRPYALPVGVEHEERSPVARRRRGTPCPWAIGHRAVCEHSRPDPPSRSAARIAAFAPARAASDRSSSLDQRIFTPRPSREPVAVPGVEAARKPHLARHMGHRDVRRPGSSRRAGGAADVEKVRAAACVVPGEVVPAVIYEGEEQVIALIAASSSRRSASSSSTRRSSNCSSTARRSTRSSRTCSGTRRAARSCVDLQRVVAGKELHVNLPPTSSARTPARA